MSEEQAAEAAVAALLVVVEAGLAVEPAAAAVDDRVNELHYLGVTGMRW